MAVQNYRERTTQSQASQLLTFDSEFRTLKYETLPSNARGARPLLTRQIPRNTDSEPTINLLNESSTGFQFSGVGFGQDQGGIEIPGIGLPTRALGGDYLLRGGILQPIRLVEDTLRLSKWFASIDGLLFTAKQNQLARGGFNPFARDKNREGVYVPTSTILAASLGANNGIHLNKQGINPFTPTDGDGGRGAAQGNQDGGVLEFLSNLGGGRPFYLGENIVGGEEGNTNALVQRTRGEIGEFNIDTFQFEPSRGGFGRRTVGNPNERESFDSGRKTRTGLYKIGGGLDAYINSDLSDDEDRADYQNLLTQQGGEIVYSGSESPPDLTFTRTTPQSGASSLFKQNLALPTDSASLSEDLLPTQNYLSQRDREGIDAASTFSEFGNPDGGFFNPDFRKVNNPDFRAPNYTDRNIEDRVMTGNPGGEGDRSDYQTGKTVGGQRQVADKINFSPIYQSGLGPDASRVRNEVNDLVKFRIAAVDADNPSNSFYMHFRSYIDSFQDNYNAEWNPQRFLGRGENFYKYQGFDRDIALSFTVAAQSKPELMRMYHKLNYLATNLMPDFTRSGYMSGPLLRLTIGGYLYEQYGFLQSLNYQIPTESPWEIAIPSSGTDGQNETIPFSDPTVKEMPHIIQVTGFQFKPIHNFVPRKQRLSTTSGNGVGEFGNERPIALSNGFAHADGYRESNYNG